MGFASVPINVFYVYNVAKRRSRTILRGCQLAVCSDRTAPKTVIVLLIIVKREAEIMPKLYLHEAMRRVMPQGIPIPSSKVAESVARRGLYLRKDGQTAPDWQILLRARKYPHLFQVENGLVVRL